MSESIANPNSVEVRAEQFLSANARMLGAQVLILLRSQPDHSVSLAELCRCIYHQDKVVQGHSPLNSHPLPLADKRAQAQYLERCKVLRQRQAQGDPDPDLAWELHWLEAELRRITLPRGGIKYEHPELDKAYHNFFTAVWKLLRKAKKKDQELASYLRSQLRTGLDFVWFSAGDSYSVRHTPKVNP